MKSIAVIGAGGYVGSRLVERAVLTGDLPIVPIVRSWRSQGRLARFGFRTVHGDANNVESLVPLLQGCQMAINLTMGENAVMVENVQAIYEACRVAGVSLLVHTSSAEVFGRANSRELEEDSIPSPKHWMEYGRAKVECELWLRSKFDGPVRVVILRPGLVWGPGSGWLVEPARALVQGTACLINEGRGICNLIHVDNLIAHFERLARAGNADSGVFNVSDIETLSWRDYFSAIAKEVGVDENEIHMLPDDRYRADILERIRGLAQLTPATAMKRRLSDDTVVRIKQLVEDRIRPPRQCPEPVGVKPLITKQAWWLQGTVSKLPATAFRERYPDTPLQPFSTLMPAAGRWLRYAGFSAREEWRSRGAQH